MSGDTTNKKEKCKERIKESKIRKDELLPRIIVSDSIHVRKCALLSRVFQLIDIACQTVTGQSNTERET